MTKYKLEMTNRRGGKHGHVATLNKNNLIIPSMPKTPKTPIHLIATAILILATAPATASHLTKPPLPNPNDGCSCVPDFDFRRCCEIHDLAYHHGGSSDQRKRADQIFRKCIKEFDHNILDDVYYIGVRAGGVPWLPTPWRWGFGYHYKKGHRGYTAHSEQTEKILQEDKK